MLMIVVLMLLTGMVVFSMHDLLFPEKDVEENSKVKTRVLRYDLEAGFGDGRMMVKREGAFLYLYLVWRTGETVKKRIPKELVKIILIDDYDFPHLEIKQEIRRFPSGRVEISRELYRLYIQKDRINSGLSNLGGKRVYRGIFGVIRYKPYL